MRISSALLAADFVLSPFQPDEYSIDGTTQRLQVVVAIQQRFNKSLRRRRDQSLRLDKFVVSELMEISVAQDAIAEKSLLRFLLERILEEPNQRVARALGLHCR